MDTITLFRKVIYLFAYLFLADISWLSQLKIISALLDKKTAWIQQTS